ncbi:N-acetylglucosamine-6-phosphate deacetylase [Heyndrickxia coagulans]|nr:N-acetylglucosamine-6-phosphate deacetylase [Heyndrickxia coagulans]
MNQSRDKKSLTVGKDADFVLLDEQLRAKATYHLGERK